MNGLMPAPGQRCTRSTVASDLQMEIRERNAKKSKNETTRVRCTDIGKKCDGVSLVCSQERRVNI